MSLLTIGTRSGFLFFAALLLTGCYSYLSPEASKEFHARVDPFSVSVYPVNVIRPPGTIHPDTRLAEQVVTFLETEQLAKAVLAKAVTYAGLSLRRSRTALAPGSAISVALVSGCLACSTRDSARPS